MRCKIVFFSLFLSISCTNNDQPGENNNIQSNVASISYTVTAPILTTLLLYRRPGFYKGHLLESTGNYGKSKILITDIKTGKPLKQIKLDSAFFGEGLAVLNDTIYQLTYKEKVVHVYSKDLKKIKQFSINTEGWGLTTDGQHLIAGDGTSNLYYYEPRTFRLLRTLDITENGSPAPNINELEYINGYLYANQWQYNYILKIDPNSGQVVGKLDLKQLGDRAKARNPNEQWLNGIAYDSTTKKIYVTGKYWPELYEIEFNH